MDYVKFMEEVLTQETKELIEKNIPDISQRYLFNLTLLDLIKAQYSDIDSNHEKINATIVTTLNQIHSQK